MPAYQDSCQKQEPSLSSSMETYTSTEESESLPGSSSFTSLSVADINHESFSSNDESSSHESLDDEFSSPTIIDLVDHDGMSTTLTQTSEEPSRTLSSLNHQVHHWIIMNVCHISRQTHCHPKAHHLPQIRPPFLIVCTLQVTRTIHLHPP